MDVMDTKVRDSRCMSCRNCCYGVRGDLDWPVDCVRARRGNLMPSGLLHCWCPKGCIDVRGNEERV